jgi:hypothetical protein
MTPNPTQRTAASLASLGIFGFYRKGKGWSLYKCGVQTATKLNFVFSTAEFENIKSTYIGFMTNKQLKASFSV